MKRRAHERGIRRVREQYGELLYALEWLFTLLFTVEYVLRLMSVRRPLRYATSFFGVVDLLAIIPTYLRHSAPERRRRLFGSGSPQ